MSNGALEGGIDFDGTVNDVRVSGNQVLLATTSTLLQYAVADISTHTAPRLISPQPGYTFENDGLRLFRDSDRVVFSIRQGTGYDGLKSIDVADGLVPPDSSYIAGRDIGADVTAMDSIVGCFTALGTAKTGQEIQVVDPKTNPPSVHGTTLALDGPAVDIAYDAVMDRLYAITANTFYRIAPGAGVDSCAL